MERMKGAAALVLGVFAAYLQKYTLLYALVAIAVLMDLVSGMAAAILSNEGLSSDVARRGLMKKLMLLFAVGWGTFLDILLPYAARTIGIELPSGMLFSAVICVYISIGESISVMENICRATDKQPPAVIVKLLRQVKDKIEKENQ